MDTAKFDISLIIKNTSLSHKSILQQKQVIFQHVFQILEQLCLIFKQLNTFLGIAFDDIKSKLEVIRNNNKSFPGHNGFVSFVLMQINHKIHIYNGQNNSKLRAPQQYKHYNSTSRNLLRVMWLFSFVRVAFQRSLHNRTEALSTILGVAYDEAFGQNHSWLVRKSAKVAIYASPDRRKLVETLLGQYDQDKYIDLMQQFLKHFVPLHQFLWDFYREHKIDRLQ